MRCGVGTWVKSKGLIVIEAVGYGLSAAKEKTSIACTFSLWNTYAHGLYSTKQTASARPQRRPNVGRSAAWRQVVRVGTNLEADWVVSGWVDAQSKDKRV